MPHLYGLGPLEGLRGEVSIFGGVPSIARIEREMVVTAASWHARACFLVWAQVPAWFERAFDGSTEAVPAGLDGIERAMVALASETSLDPERPLPFRVRVTAVEATFHVLDKNQVRVLGEIEDLARRGMAVMLSTHDPDHAFLCAHRVALLHQGRLARLGPPDAVITRESLREVYGVEVTVMEVARAEGRVARVCVPALSATGHGARPGRPS